MEEHTRRLAAGPWRTLGGGATGRLDGVLADCWAALLSSGPLPSASTLGTGLA